MGRRARLPVLALTAALIASLALAASASSFHIIFVVLGPKTPKARSTHGMKLTFKPSKGPAGTQFKGTGCCFRSGEYVTAWQYKGGRSSQLLGGNAPRSGRLPVFKDTIPGISKRGRYKLCLQGERTRRVACGSFTITPGTVDGVSGPEGPETKPDSGEGGTGPGYVPPTTGPGYVPPTSDGDYQPPTVGPGYVPPGSA